MEADSVASRSFIRTVLMYGFHTLVVILVSRKIKDTQCGFKLFTRSTAKVLFTLMHLDKWSFDIELVYLAEALRIPMTEVRGYSCRYLFYWNLHFNRWYRLL